MPSDPLTFQFLADMGVARGVVEHLRQHGHDVIHLREEGLQRMPDKEIFAKAIHEGRVVITFDLDFGEIAAATGGAQISVIIFRLPHAQTPYVIERLNAVLAAAGHLLSTGIIATVEASRIRIRQLPIGGK